MIIARMDRSKFKEGDLISWSLNQKTIETLKEIVKKYDDVARSGVVLSGRFVVKALDETTKQKLENPPEFFLEFVEKQDTAKPGGL